MNQPGQHNISILLNKWYNNTATDTEKQELFTYLSEDNLEEELNPFIKEQWKQLKPQNVLSETEVNALANRVITGIAVPKYKQVPIHRIHLFKTAWFRYAAAIIILLTGTAIWYTQRNHSKSFNPLNPSSRQIAIAPGRDRAILTLANGQQIALDSTQGNIIKQGGLTVVNLAGKLDYEGIDSKSEYHTLSTPRGGQYKLILPDGSAVWLNAASSITYPTAFISKERTVIITGEAYFEIAKNNKQPFVVKTNGVEVQVLGTGFNINAYSDEANIKTTLIEGSVRVKTANDDVILKPADMAILESSKITDGANKLKVINNVDIEQTLAWKNGTFQFNHSNLADVMRQLARWYDIEVVYEKGIPTIQLEGNIKRNLTLSELLDGLKELGIRSRVEGKRLIIM